MTVKPTTQTYEWVVTGQTGYFPARDLCINSAPNLQGLSTAQQIKFHTTLPLFQGTSRDFSIYHYFSLPNFELY